MTVTGSLSSSSDTDYFSISVAAGGTLTATLTPSSTSGNPDLAKNAVAGEIADTPGIHGIAIAPDLGRVFTSNGADNKVSIVNAKDFTTVMKVETGANPDAIMYEATKKMVWSFNHTGKSATVIDAQSGKVMATIPLSGAVETGQAAWRTIRQIAHIQLPHRGVHHFIACR